LPKTIDNDVAMTDATFGFATRWTSRPRRSTVAQHGAQPSPHHRRGNHGHRAGWLTLARALRRADVILIPEIPYDVVKIAEAIRRRSRRNEFQHRRVAKAR